MTVLLALCAALAASPATAQGPFVEPPPEGGLIVAIDADDDDEDGVADAAEGARVPEEDLVALRFRPGLQVTLRVEGPFRLLRAGGSVPDPFTIRTDAGSPAQLQALRAGSGALVVEAGSETTRVPLRAVGVALLAADNARIDPTRAAVGVSHEITNSASLPRESGWDGTSQDPDNIRIEVFDPGASGDEIRVALVSHPPGDARVRGTLGEVVLRRPRAGAAFRSPWLRLVTDTMDVEAPGVGHRVLRVALRDVVEVRYATPGGVATQSVRVGRPGDERGPDAARRARLRVRILRMTPGGTPVVGGDEAGALRLAREQLAIANEVWCQCFISFGRPEDADIAVVDPPPPTLLAVSDADGLPARGGGTIRLRVEGRPIRPVTTRAGAPPVDTALRIAAAVRALGFDAQVTENARTESGAGRSADVLVRTSAGRPVTLSADGNAPLTTDPQQTVQIGEVDMGDGIREFNNMNAASGTLEERTLLKAIIDDDTSTIELVVINVFASGTRQGEAFIEGDGGAIANVVLLDRNGMRQQRAAWTQSHEVGHVLLNQPFHPDNVGPDRPWLLMDADSSLPTVTGPKRLSWDECHRVRIESGIDAVPALLSPLDPRPTTPQPQPFDPGY